MITPSHTRPVHDWYEANWTAALSAAVYYGWHQSRYDNGSAEGRSDAHWEAMHVLAMEANPEAARTPRQPTAAQPYLHTRQHA